MLHFDRIGTHAVSTLDLSQNGIPDFIDSAAIILDYVWEMEVNVLGYQPPLGIDGTAVPVYSIFFKNLLNEYGSTFSTGLIPSPPGYYRYTSYIVLDNDYQNINFQTRGLDGLKVTAAHEFHHAIQLSYRVWWENSEAQDIFLMEMTSSWLEDILYERINNYLFNLPYFFQKFSGSSFTSMDYLYPYGNSLFWHMLEKEFGVMIGREVWENIKIAPGIQSLEEILSDHHSSFTSQLHQYGIWLNFTGSNADTDIYLPEGQLYPQLIVAAVDRLPYENPIEQLLKIPGLATRIFEINSLPADDFYTRTGSTRIPGLVSHLNSQGVLNTVAFIHDGEFYNQENSNTRVLITNASQDTCETAYLLSSEKLQPNQDLLVYPNPVVTNEDENLTFMNLPEEGTIYIFNSQGENIFHFSNNESQQEISWDLRDEWGYSISSGIYLYIFSGKKVRHSGKFAVVR